MCRKCALVAFFSLAVFFFACKAKSAIDLQGAWRAALVFEQELASADDEDTVIASAEILQENTFVFCSDGSFSRTVNHRLQKIHSFSSDVSVDAISALYGLNTFEIAGTYSFSGKNLNLVADTILVDGKSLPYADFFESTKVFGEPKMKTKLKIKDENTILIQGIQFFRLVSE